MPKTSVHSQNMLVEPRGQSDDRLLQAYLKSNDQEAFAVLVQRYGPMVWGVCRRILRRTHDAEDAFQATFAVLVRKAPSIRQKRAIGGWLHQVARRAALRASAKASRQGDVMDWKRPGPRNGPRHRASRQTTT